MPRTDLLFIALVAVGLSGCAGMSEQECLVTDWRAVGFEDRAAGRAETSIAGFRQACGQHGIAPNLDQYRSGHAEGVEVYCRPSRGFDEGRRGRRYQNVCPLDIEPGFLAAYNEGRQLYELESTLRAIDNQIAARHSRLEAIDKKLANTAIAIIADGTGAERRAELLLETKSLSDEHGAIEIELEELEIQRVLAEGELLAYQETLAYGG